MQTVRVNRKAAERVRSGHPWIFLSDVVDHGEAEAGSAVKVVGPGRNGSLAPLGIFHYSSTSQISLRLLSAREAAIDKSFFLEKIETANQYRKRVVHDSDSYRLVFGEADGLPGLVVDRYGEYFTVQMLDQGMDRASTDILDSLEGLFHPKGIVARNDAAVRKQEALPQESGVVRGEVPDHVPVHMNGLRWQADLLRGQKTGVFLDQRENYQAAARFAHGPALDCFTSTGGFALHLAPHCERVEAVDSSTAALATAQANANANGIANIQFRQADAFELLAQYASARKQFSTVILDPPAFTKSRKALEGAARGYKDINLRALRLLDRGGILVTCSCSHHMSEAALLQIVAEAALDAGRRLRVLERRTQSLDHPILLTVPETLYLKCLIFEVI